MGCRILVVFDQVMGFSNDPAAFLLHDHGADRHLSHSGGLTRELQGSQHRLALFFCIACPIRVPLHSLKVRATPL